MPDRYERIVLDVECRTDKAEKGAKKAGDAADDAHIKTTELRRTMALMRRDLDLFQDLLEQQGVKVDENTKKLFKLFDQTTMIISDGARVIRMVDAIGWSVTSALGVIGILIEAILVLQQLWNWANATFGNLPGFGPLGNPRSQLNTGEYRNWIYNPLTFLSGGPPMLRQKETG